MSNSQNECYKLLDSAQHALEKTKGQPEDDLRSARNIAALIDNQNNVNKELLNYIYKYDKNILCIVYYTVLHLENYFFFSFSNIFSFSLSFCMRFSRFANEI